MNFSSLARTISCLFESAVISGHFTNHSLRATAATRMFDAGVDEQLIMNCTGHSSTSGMRSYKRITTGLKEMTFNVLNESEPEKFKKNLNLRNLRLKNLLSLTKTLSLRRLLLLQSIWLVPAILLLILTISDYD